MTLLPDGGYAEYGGQVYRTTPFAGPAASVHLVSGDGGRRLVVPRADVTVFRLTTTCRWLGEPFRVSGRLPSGLDPTHLDLTYLGRRHDRAAALGLTAGPGGLYTAVVGEQEVTELRQERQDCVRAGSPWDEPPDRGPSGPLPDGGYAEWRGVTFRASIGRERGSVTLFSEVVRAGMTPHRTGTSWTASVPQAEVAWFRLTTRCTWQGRRCQVVMVLPDGDLVVAWPGGASPELVARLGLSGHWRDGLSGLAPAGEVTDVVQERRAFD